MSIVDLNVGGEFYSTSLSTLTKYPDSMLGAMFNGQFHTAKDINEKVFIDRDGKLFRYILNFLRTSMLALPTDFKDYEALCIEADFYLINPLITSLHDWKRQKNEDELAQKKSQKAEMEESEREKNQRMCLLNVIVKGDRNEAMGKPSGRDRDAFYSRLIRGKPEMLRSIPSQFFRNACPEDSLQEILQFYDPRDTDAYNLELCGSETFEVSDWREELTEHLLYGGCRLLSSHKGTDDSWHDVWWCDVPMLKSIKKSCEPPLRTPGASDSD